MFRQYTTRHILGRIILACTVGFGSLIGIVTRAEETIDKAAKQPTTIRELIDQSSTQCEVFPNADAEVPATVLTALRWANNARGSEDGVTLLFVHAGQPLAAACVYPWAQRIEFDFESLSRDKIVARQNGAIIWQPQEPAVKFVDIPGAETPDGTRAARLRQIKSLAKRFHATMLGWKADKTDREELRLLPKPLFRYDPKSEKIVDGAVFAFVMGTDPEVLLQIEAVKVGDKLTWQYAFARRTSGELEGRVDNSVVWHADRYPTQNDPRRPHFTRGVPIPPEILAAEQAKVQATQK